MVKVYVDEVGCASIAGPVLVCAVAVADSESKIEGVGDSKQLSKKKREELFPILENNLEHVFAISTPERIEEINIHWAKYEAMKNAVEELVARGIKVSKVIVDGKFEIPDLDIEQEAIVKADDKLWQVGAASILAKVKRDNLMAELAKEIKYSYYDWENNAGYYSPNHREGIILCGPCDLHRKKFAYFRYCLERHKEYLGFLKEGKTAQDYFAEEARRSAESAKSDFVLWKEAKKNKWKPILPNVEKFLLPNMGEK